MTAAVLHDGAAALPQLHLQRSATNATIFVENVHTDAEQGFSIAMIGSWN